MPARRRHETGAPVIGRSGTRPDLSRSRPDADREKFTKAGMNESRKRSFVALSGMKRASELLNGKDRGACIPRHSQRASVVPRSAEPVPGLLPGSDPDLKPGSDPCSYNSVVSAAWPDNCVISVAAQGRAPSRDNPQECLPDSQNRQDGKLGQEADAEIDEIKIAAPIRSRKAGVRDVLKAVPGKPGPPWRVLDPHAEASLLDEPESGALHRFRP